MKSKEMQKILHGYGDDLDVKFVVPGVGANLVPIGHHRLNASIVFDSWEKVLKGYAIRKGFIKGDATEVCPLPMLGLIDTREQAAVFIAKNVFDEIGWKMPDIAGKFTEVLNEVKGTSPERKYSFANCEWWIEEVY